MMRLSMIAFLVAAALLATCAAQSWQTRSPMPVSRSDFTVLTTGTTFFVACGCVGNQSDVDGCPAITNRLEAYNTLTDQWTELAPAPRARTQYQAAAVPVTTTTAGTNTTNATTTTNWLLYYIGGRALGQDGLISEVDVYNVTGGTWSTLAATLTAAQARSNGAAFVIDGVIYVTGGYDDRYDSLNTTIVLDTTAGPLASQAFTLSTVTKPSSSGDCGAEVIGGKGYVFGGFDSTEAGGNGFCHPLGRLEVYDPISNSWSTKASINTARGLPASAVVSGLLFVMGGEGKIAENDNWCINGSEISRPINDVEYYNPATNTWTFVDDIPVSRFRFSGNVGGANLQTIYNIGGQAGEIITNTSVNPLDPFADSGYWPVTNLVESRDVSDIVARVNGISAATHSSCSLLMVMALLLSLAVAL